MDVAVVNNTNNLKNVYNRLTQIGPVCIAIFCQVNKKEPEN